MNDFLKSLKSDLLDRRLVPVLGLLAVVLVAAVAYAALGGGSSEPATSATSAATPVAKAPGIAVSQVKTADVSSSAETTSGSSQQTGGASRNPFAPLPGAEKTDATEATTTASSAGGASSTSESSSSSSGEGSSSPAEETKPSTTKPKATQTVYHVAVLFGTATPGSTTPSTPLTPFENLKRQQPLPSDSQPLVVFRGVLAGGKSATFTLVGEAILRGDGKCLPNATQCQAIDLKPGQTEELEYTPPGGVAVNYQLQVVRIKSSKAAASAARRAFHGESKTGLALLHNAGLETLPGLRYSAAKGVLVFAGGHTYAARTPTFAASAHVSAWGIPLKG